MTQNVLLITKHLEGTKEPLEYKGLEGKIVWLSLGHNSKRIANPNVSIEPLGQLWLISELHENMAKCTFSTCITVNTEHELVRIEQRVGTTVIRNPLTCLPREILKCWSMKNKEIIFNRKYS